MKREFALSLALIATPVLGGCVAQAALAGLQLASTLPGSDKQSNAHLKPAAKQACTQRAAQYGAFDISAVEQRRADRLVVSGSVLDATQRRRAYECHFTTRIVDFKLREIAAHR